MLTDLLDDLLCTMPVAYMMRFIETLGHLDRYQASIGIEDAATLVSGQAREIGLSEVTINRYPANGQKTWWSYRAPISWTPLIATLSLIRQGRTIMELDHQTSPFTVATYSAPTPEGGHAYELREWCGTGRTLKGCIWLLEPDQATDRTVLNRLVEEGAAGFITAASAVHDLDGQVPGRIELNPGSSLFAFSTTEHQFEQLRQAARDGVFAQVDITIDRSARMPVVSALLPGKSLDEIWITAHLCHPRPGANDNGSGVASLLGMGRCLLGLQAREPNLQFDKTVRFVWGPEFLGSTAELHRALKAGREPLAVINMDMVGEDQALCQCPFVVEREPDDVLSVLGPIAEAATAEVFKLTDHGAGRWRSSPFLGYSDHAVFLTGEKRSPAIQFCHHPDRFNHSAADTMDKVSELEMARSVAAATSVTVMLASSSDAWASVIRNIVSDWTDREMARLNCLASKSRWHQRYRNHGATYCDRLMAVASSNRFADYSDHNELDGRLSMGSVLVRMWSGPINIRAMMEDLPENVSNELTGLFVQDKSNYALLMNMALRINARRSRHEILQLTSYGMGYEIDEITAQLLLDALLMSGWVLERDQPHIGV